MSYTYEVTLVSGNAEASMLICARCADEAKLYVQERVLDGNVCWEGNPGKSFKITNVEKRKDVPGYD
jgi:hypothetical protein